MDGTLLALRSSVLLAVGLSVAACNPVVATIDTGTTVDDACNGTGIVGPSGAATGFERCADGVVLRSEAVTGVTTRIAEARCTADEGTCSSDGDCTARTEGACLDRGIQFPWCTCVYACSADRDCDTGQICLPPGVWEAGPAWGTCVPASCRTNADCPSEECSFTAWNDGCSDIVQLACRTPDDVCRTDQDCPDGTPDRSICAFDGTGTLACVGPNCDIGRPFTDDAGEWRRAPTVPRDDWAADLAAAAAGLTEEQRRSLIAHWIDVAALEHASVASFARHTLELLALGAPADLVADVQQAAADEVRHAQLAYGMVQALGGESVGPGALDVVGMGPRATPGAVLEALLREGCVGETFGAAEAALASSRATGSAGVVMAEIATDEARHAVLAWRTVRWLLGAHPELGPVLDRIRAPEPHPAGPAHPLAAHGLLADDERAALHRRVWDQVVAPAHAGLRARVSSPASGLREVAHRA